MTSCSRLPVHSDRIAQDLHLIPFYPYGKFPSGTENSNIRFLNDLQGPLDCVQSPHNVVFLPGCGGYAAHHAGTIHEEEKQKNRTDWDLRPIMSCSNTYPVVI
jgi:hypothetical protein